MATYGYTSGPWDASREESNRVRPYTEGTLIVDFVDAKSKQLVWRGTATDTITSAESVQKSVDSAAHQLLAAYPPKRE